MAVTDAPPIIKLGIDDAIAGLALSTEARWNQTEEDWRIFLRDGIVFENREGLLPAETSGYYHEYTVPTPGASDRGARRIIRGSGGELYWTDDHYRSFERISP